MIIVICAYCQKHMGTKEGGEGVSHGICAECLKEQDKLLKEMVKEQQHVNRQN